jgi:hypothetical protein
MEISNSVLIGLVVALCLSIFVAVTLLNKNKKMDSQSRRHHHHHHSGSLEDGDDAEMDEETLEPIRIHRKASTEQQPSSSHPPGSGKKWTPLVR